MAQREQTSPPPLVLIANDQEWSTRALESILGPRGYAVLRAYTGQQALQQARSANPDLVILAHTLPEMTGSEVCRALREETIVTRSTAVLITVAGPSTREQRLTALRDGASDVLAMPVDAEELALRLDAFIRAKRDADHAREEGLVDLATGLYNMQGLARRAREIGSQAFRHRTALACIVFAPEPAAAGSPDPAAEEALAAQVLDLAQAFRAHGRVSDAIGRMGRNEIAVFAPGTDAAGAVKLAERLAHAMKPDGSGGAKPKAARPPMRAGYFAIPDFHESPIEPVNMLVRATTA
ncbi:MAG: response regulator, partial [Gemmatimonadales bacterium]